MPARYIKISVLIVLLCCGTPSKAQYDFNKRCKDAYNSIVCLDIGTARILLNAEKAAQPDNLIVPFLENGSDFLTVVATEDPALFQLLKDNKERRIAMLEKGNKSAPWYRYCLAEVYLQWAGARIIFGEYVTAAYEINKAYRLLKRNREEFPTFIPNLKSLGLLNALIGSIPDNYKWLGRIIGAEGTVEEGVTQLGIVLHKAINDANYDYLKAEALFFMAYVTINLGNDRTHVDRLIRVASGDAGLLKLAQSSALVNFGMANLYLRSKNNCDKGIKILQDFESCARCVPFAYRYYALGLARLNRLDDDADNDFKKFLELVRGQNFIKAAYQKLAWHALLQNDIKQYRSFMKKVTELGLAETDDDKAALEEANSGHVPDATLLKARLLFDGGYYSRAILTLNEADTTRMFEDKRKKLEYYYRMGRVCHESGDTAGAILLYLKTVDEGSEMPWYYAANASLQLGLIYESQGRKSLAIEFYERALRMPNTEYKNSISQKAKAGLNRLKAHSG